MPGDPGSDLSLVLRAIQSLDNLFEDSHRDEDRFLADRHDLAEIFPGGSEFASGAFACIAHGIELRLQFFGRGALVLEGGA